MRKIRIYTPLIILAMGMSVSFANIHVNAATTEATTETTEEATDDSKEEKKEKKEKKWVTDNLTGRKQYQIDQEPVIGWKKIKKKWYYFGADTFLVTNTHIGPYEVDANGVLQNPGTDEDFKPLPHGSIYNSSGSVAVKDGNENVIKLVNDINTLYESFKTNVELNPEDIRKLRYLYNSLTMAEKANIPNETYLAEMELANKVVYDYSKIYATATDAVSKDGKSKVGTNYTFEITDKKSAITVVVRYTTDTNMDGIGDKPVVSLISPDGVTTPITEESPQLRNTSINAALTWTDNFVQFDIVNAENGNWTINTDINCTFTSKEYAGNMKNLNPIPADEKPATQTDPDEDTTKEKKKTPIGSILLIVFAVGGFAGLMIFMKKKPVETKGKKEDIRINQTSEDDMESLRQELEKMNEEFRDDYPDEPAGTTVQSKQPYNTDTFSQEEIKESLEDYGVGYDVEDTYDQTYNQPAYEPQQYAQPYNEPYAENTMQASNQPIVTAETADTNATSMSEEDEWYEEEE